MIRRRADVIVGSLVVAVVLLGAGLSWGAYRQNRALDEAMGSMMGGTDMGLHGANPVWYVLATVLLSAIILGFYAILRPDLDQAADAVQDPSQGRDSSVAATVDSATHPSQSSRSDILEVLPDDERRILEPVIDSPGITQIALRDRSEFSKSKVSQTVSELEKRGLLYRERQGRTYRVYPSDDI